MRTSFPSPKGGGEAPNFRPISAVAKTAGWIEMVGLLSMEVGLSRSNLDVRPRWGPSSPYPKRRLSLPPQFSAHFYCGQTAECIKMPLGTEVGLGPDNIVLDGDPAPFPKKGAEPPPQFSAHVYCGQKAGYIKMTLGMEVGLGPDNSSSPNFWSIFIVAKRLDASRCHLVWR